jgi:hypothetical protein
MKKIFVLLGFIQVATAFHYPIPFESVPQSIQNLKNSFVRLTIQVGVEPNAPLTYCSGTLLNQQLILTAAHCLLDKHHLKQVKWFESSLVIDDSIRYKIFSYKPRMEVGSDIAIIKFEHKFLHAVSLKPFIITNYESTSALIFNPHSKLFALGWSQDSLKGATTFGNNDDDIRYSYKEAPDYLNISNQESDVIFENKIITYSAPKYVGHQKEAPYWHESKWEEGDAISITNTINFYQTNQKNPMYTDKGDSGGPLFAGNDTSGYSLIGIASSHVPGPDISRYTTLCNPYFTMILHDATY